MEHSTMCDSRTKLKYAVNITISYEQVHCRELLTKLPILSASVNVQRRTPYDYCHDIDRAKHERKFWVNTGTTM